MTRAYLGLGANIGNRRANLRLALRWLEGAGRVVGVSSLYRSAAVVAEGEPPGPDFLNAACAVETELDAAGLLRAVKAIERAIGRRPAARWAPRPIDIDILLFGEEIIDTAELQAPHPLLATRNFVVLPLAEIAGEVPHPVLGRTIGELAEDVDFTGLEHLEEPGWEARETAESESQDEEQASDVGRTAR